MPEVHYGVKGRELGQFQRFVSGEMPRVTEDTGGSRRSEHTYRAAGWNWTSDRAAVLAPQHATEVRKVSVASELAGAELADTSSALEGVPELESVPRVLSRALGQRVVEIGGLSVVKLDSRDMTSVSELREKLRERAPVDPELATRKRALLARAGGGLTTTQVAQRLNVSEPEVDELRAAGRVLAVPDPDGADWTYPACQFEGPRVVSGLCEVLSDFAVKSAWTRLYVLISKDPALHGRTPIEALRDGDLDLIREIVRGYGQQGGA